MSNMKLLPSHYSIPAQTNLLLQVLPLHNVRMLFVIEHSLSSSSTLLVAPFVGLLHALPFPFLISYLDNFYINVLPLYTQNTLSHLSIHFSLWSMLAPSSVALSIVLPLVLFFLLFPFPSLDIPSIGVLLLYT